MASANATKIPELTCKVTNAGKYLAIAVGGAYCLSATGLTLWLGKNNTAEENTRQLILWHAEGERLSVGIQYVFDLSANDEVNFFLAGNGQGQSAFLRKGFSLAIIRIG